MTGLCSESCFHLFHLSSTPLIVFLSLFFSTLQEASKGMGQVLLPCRLKDS